MLSFTDDERARIQQAIRQAESRTTAEIVPMIVPSSARYREAGYRTGLILGWLTLACLLTLESFWVPWGWHAGNAGWLLLAVIAAYGLGEWLGTWPVVIRLVTSHERMAYKVQLRAEQAFYHHGLQHTKGRTAVLILISLLEHRVHVLADQGLNVCVPAGTWDELVHDLIEGIRAGNQTEAICKAIARCGELLADKCPVGPKENPNEVPDRLIQEP